MTKFRFFKILGLLFLFNTFSQAQSGDIDIIKNRVLDAMGGMKAYNDTRYISWNFFGSRNLVWDKHKNKVRIDYSKENTVLILDMNQKNGKVLKNGIEITQPDSLNKYLEDARKTWINDSYWLVMPFKLSDPGVKLKYLGTSKTEEGEEAKLIELTFENVGVTPENKYHVFFDEKSGLVSQWSFFSKYSDEKPRFTMPWKDYQSYGKIKLSGDRGARKLTNIMVFNKLDKSVFENFNKPAFIK